MFFDRSVTFDPSVAADAFLKSVPAKGAVYLFTDAADAPVQLLSVGNLRQSLKRRLFGEEQIGPSKRVNYRDLVRHIHWHRVDSRFEADWIYYEAARQIFPQSYQGMVGFRPAWFVHVDPDAKFPRYVKTIDLSPRRGKLLGPFEDKHAAARWIQLVEDAFDLCRYYNVLLDSPRAKACAYKEMGRCPAPCDGSIGMAAYRQLIEWSWHVAIDPTAMIAQQTHRMQEAAGELRFESAAKIKSYLEQISSFGKGPFQFVRTLEEFKFLSLQRGQRPGTAKAFLITPGQICESAGLINEPNRASDLIRHLLWRIEKPSDPLDAVGAERVGVASHHLFAGKRTSGVFLPVREVDDRSLLKAFKEIVKQKVVQEEGEGLVSELQTL